MRPSTSALLISVNIGGSSNYDNGNYGVYTGFNDYGNINWFNTPQAEDDYDGYDGGNDGGFYGEPDSEGFPDGGNYFGPTTPSAYIDPVQEMIYQDYRRYQNNREFDGIQRTLDTAGLVPVFGNVADLVNAGISAARGNWKDAAMSLGAAVPGVGIAAGLYRLGKGAKKGLKGSQKLFLSEKFGITSERFAHSATGVSGRYNKAGSVLKLGWSNTVHKGGGMIFRMGFGKQGNKAFLHFNFPGTFVRNDFANSSILLKRALR